MAGFSGDHPIIRLRKKEIYSILKPYIPIINKFEKVNELCLELMKLSKLRLERRQKLIRTNWEVRDFEIEKEIKEKENERKNSG